VLFSFKIVGAPLTDGEKDYFTTMKKIVHDLDLDAQIEWAGAISNHELPPVLQQSDIFIHDGATNSLDKALLEASLCGCIVVSSNPAYKGVTSNLAPEYLYTQGDSESLARIIIGLKGSSMSTKMVGDSFSHQFSVSNLISGIVTTY
jgi:glycosyltransferase involved in cell wall biosynthesis